MVQLKEVKKIENCLVSGIDSLYVGWRCGIPDELAKELNVLKLEAQDSDKPVEIVIQGYAFQVEPYGHKPYKYMLRNNDLIIYIHDKAKSWPSVYVHFLSEYLWRCGYKKAYKIVDKWVKSFTKGLVIEDKKIDRDGVLSRIDLASDFKKLKFSSDDLENFVTRARARHSYSEIPVDTFMQGRKFTGFRFGKGKLVCRIYDKLEEIKNNGKGWFIDVWSRLNDFKPEDFSSVWRIEYQIRREALKQFQIVDKKTGEILGQNVELVLDSLDSIWKYLAGDWCSLRTPCHDLNMSRWDYADRWKHVIEAGWSGDKDYAVIRDSIKTLGRDLKMDMLIPGLCGYLSELGAIMNQRQKDRFLKDKERRGAFKISMYRTPGDVLEALQERLDIYYGTPGKEPFWRQIEIKESKYELMQETWEDIY